MFPLSSTDDSSRVILSTTKDANSDDFINANYIDVSQLAFSVLEIAGGRPIVHIDVSQLYTGPFRSRNSGWDISDNYMTTLSLVQ